MNCPSTVAKWSVTYTDLRSGRRVVRIERQFVTESYERFASPHAPPAVRLAGCRLHDPGPHDRQAPGRALVHVDEPEV